MAMGTDMQLGHGREEEDYTRVVNYPFLYFEKWKSQALAVVGAAWRGSQSTHKHSVLEHIDTDFFRTRG